MPGARYRTRRPEGKGRVGAGFFCAAQHRCACFALATRPRLGQNRSMPPTTPTPDVIRDSIAIMARRDADAWAAERVATLPTSLEGVDRAAGILGLIRQLVRSSEADTPYAAALWREFDTVFNRLSDAEKYQVQRASVEPFRTPLPPAVKFWRAHSRAMRRPELEAKWHTNAWTLFSDLPYHFSYELLPIPTGVRVAIPKGFLGIIHPHWYLVNKGVYIWAREPVSPNCDEEIKVYARTVAKGLSGNLTDIPEFSPLCYLLVVRASEVRALYEEGWAEYETHAAERGGRLPPIPPDYGQW